MMEIKINRRQLLKGSVNVLAAIGVMPSMKAWAKSASMLFSASTDRQGKHYLTGFNLQGDTLFHLPVSDRAHDCCLMASKPVALFFSRRPGTKIYAVDIHSGVMINTIESQSGHHFYGHGVLTQDDRYLFATENDFTHSQGKGWLGVYDCNDDFKKVDVIDSYGIGPHQCGILSDGKTLVIANGGILTRPETGRRKLNLDTMAPNLAYVDSQSGQLIERYFPEHHQISLRHLTVGPKDQVIIGAQFQGDESMQVPLVFTHQGEKQLQAMSMAGYGWPVLNQYIASVAVDLSGTCAVTTAPRANQVVIWSLAQRKCLSLLTLVDVAGAFYAAAEKQFIVSNGRGQVMGIESRMPEVMMPFFASGNKQWDNHMRII